MPHMIITPFMGIIMNFIVIDLVNVSTKYPLLGMKKWGKYKGYV